MWHAQTWGYIDEAILTPCQRQRIYVMWISV